MQSQPDVGVVIPAAGRGVRSGFAEPKQYRELAGVPLLLRTIRPFSSHPRVAEIAVALPPGDVDAPPAWLADLAGDALRLVAGGASRAHSVRNAVEALGAECRLVLIHDAARPFVSREVIDRLIERVGHDRCCIAAVPMGDTVKRAGSDNLVTETVDRSDLWRAQTPQGFPRETLERAYADFGDRLDELTDEAALVELAGREVELVADEAGNIKLTQPGDFDLAEKMLR